MEIGFDQDHPPRHLSFAHYFDDEGLKQWHDSDYLNISPRPSNLYQWNLTLLMKISYNQYTKQTFHFKFSGNPSATCWVVFWSLYDNTFNTLRPIQNCRHFADDIFECIFPELKLWISLDISFKFVPSVRINTIPALVQIMAWRLPGDKPLSEPMMVS